MPKLLFVNIRPFYPDSSGGAQQSAIYLFKSLQQLGWQVEVLCGLSWKSPYFQKSFWQSLRQLRKPPLLVRETDLGYPCWRQLTSRFRREPQLIKSLERRLQEYRPDVVLGQFMPICPLLNYAANRGYPSIYFARNTYKIDANSVIPNQLHLIANSPFTASVFSQITQREIEVVLPFVSPERYRVAKRERRYITFVNPVPQKGVDVAVEIARRLPQERFLFIKGKWSNRNDRYIETQIKPARSLPNVEIWENQSDMRRVYEVTDILLVPSQFNEAFGRVIIEAQLNGIPVVAANVGGIPFTVGQGGCIVEPKDEPQAYVDAIRRLRSDENFYAQRSALALQNSQRPEFDPQHQVEKFAQFVTEKVLRHEINLTA